MRHLKYKRFDYLRSLAVVLITAFGFATIIASGGGGGGDGDDGDGDVILQSIYDYRIISGNTSPSGGDPLTVNLTIDEQPVTLSLTHPDGAGISGTYETTTGNQVLIETNTAMIIQDVSANPVINDFTLDVTDLFIFQDFPANPFPISGGILVTREGDPQPDPITISVIDNNPLDAVPDVRITVGMATSEFTWLEFEALEDDPTANEDHQFAAFSYDSLMFMLVMLEFSVNALEDIGDLEAVLTSGPVVETCDAFADEGLSAPPGIPDAGELTVTWNDDNSDGTLNPGDGFNWLLADCWDNDPTDNIDDLLNGEIDTIGYTEVITSAGLIDIIGFEPFGDDPGGVIFTNFSFTETDSSTNPPTLEEVTTLNGGFSIIFQ